LIEAVGHAFAMPADLKDRYRRIMAARERVIDMRTERVAALLRLQNYLRKRLSDYFTNLDPITGSRLAELGLEGNKAHGDIALALVFFEGSRLRVGIDAYGRFSLAAEPDVFAEIGTLVGLHVADDNSTAEIEYVAAGAGQTQVHSAGFSAYLEALIDHAVASVEEQADIAKPAVP
jgi:hypothetical protein